MMNLWVMRRDVFKCGDAFILWGRVFHVETHGRASLHENKPGRASLHENKPGRASLHENKPGKQT
jgi:hypothetical protein